MSRDQPSPSLPGCIVEQPGPLFHALHWKINRSSNRWTPGRSAYDYFGIWIVIVTSQPAPPTKGHLATVFIKSAQRIKRGSSFWSFTLVHGALLNHTRRWFLREHQSYQETPRNQPITDTNLVKFAKGSLGPGMKARPAPSPPTQGAGQPGHPMK